MVALVVSIVALVLSALSALAVMELVAAGAPGVSRPDDDVIEEFEIPSEVVGTPAGSHGLPGWIEGTDRHVVLFVSPMCTMCAALVGTFDGVVPDGLTVVVTASHPARQREWAAAVGLPHDAAVFDDDMSIVARLEISSSPTVVGFGAGEVVFVAGVGGRPALDRVLDGRFAADGDGLAAPGAEWVGRPSASAWRGPGSRVDR